MIISVNSSFWIKCIVLIENHHFGEKYHFDKEWMDFLCVGKYDVKQDWVAYMSQPYWVDIETEVEVMLRWGRVKV